MHTRSGTEWRLWLALAALFIGGPHAGAEGPAPAGDRPWTLLVYGAVDNSADRPFINFMDGVRRALDNDPGIELLVFIDRSPKHNPAPTYLGDDFTGCRLYRLTQDSAQRLSGGDAFPEIDANKDIELNSADGATLGKFIAWGKGAAPARRTALLIYSHANGATMCPDDQDKAEMGIAELSHEIGPEARVDFLALELCQMGGIEIAYQWRPDPSRFSADVLLAIPNAGPPLDWHRAFARIRTPGHALANPSTPTGPAIDPAAMTPEDFGRLVIHEGRLGRQADESSRGPSEESAACYDLREAAAVKRDVDALAVALAAADAKQDVCALRNGSAEDRTISYSDDGQYVDLYDLCRRLQSCNIGAPARDAAAKVNASLERFVIASFGMSAYKGFEADRNGVFIVLPSDKAGSWEKLRWYTPRTPAGGRDYGRWSFLADGAKEGNGAVENWFELMDAWFDDGEGGGVNRYKP